MSGINTGILTNAFPLMAEQVKAVENRILEAEEAVVFLNENKEVCYAMPFGPEPIKELAWQTAYELTQENNLFVKKVYKKSGLKDFFLEKTFKKAAINDAWKIEEDYGNFILLDGSIFITNDNLIFNTKGA